MHRRKKKVVPTPQSLPVLKPNTAGIDIGSREIYVGVRPDADPQFVRRFETFTDSLIQLRDWLLKLKITSVAMESTGVYWIPLFEILEKAGIEVCLVNARHVKNIPGRKTDVQDCQWLQLLHSVGLLSSSFRPEDQICAVRSILRLRSRLVACAADQTRLIHKILTQMNVQLHHVISDVTGVTGMAILQAILQGERDPVALAKLRDPHIKASTDTIARSLNAHWRPELLFCLRTCLDTFLHFQSQIASCDDATSKLLLSFDSKVDLQTHPLPKRSRSSRSGTQANAFQFDARLQSYRIFGVDLTAVPALGDGTVMILLAELGPNFAAKFPTAKHVASWLGLCPDNRITGGRILSAKTREVKSRVAHALRLAALSLGNAKNYFGDLFRRLKARLGVPQAITAMAHKLARIIWHMIRYRQEFDPSHFQRAELRQKQKRIQRLEKTAASLGLKLSPA